MFLMQVDSNLLNHKVFIAISIAYNAVSRKLVVSKVRSIITSIRFRFEIKFVKTSVNYKTAYM